MLRHTAGHLAQGVLLLIGVVVLIFCVLQLIPGDPIQAMVGDMPVPPALRAALEQRFHLNEPFLQRLYSYLANVLHGDLGYSMNYRRPVLDILAERFPRTLLLAGTGYTFGILIGIAIGIHSAVTPHRSVDRAWSSLVLIGYAMPTFWVGQLLVIVFSINLGWLPTQGMGPMISHATGFDWLLERARYLVLPVRPTPSWKPPAWHVSCVPACRRPRAGLHRHGAAEGPVAARDHHGARGSQFDPAGHHGDGLLVRNRHGWRGLLETVFSYPGVGSLMVESVRARDTQVIVGVVILIACSVVVMNLVVDLLYAWLDPRIRVSSAQR